MTLAASSHPLTRLLDTVEALPWAAHAAVLIALIAGLVLWGTGRHVLRPVIGFCSGAAGALLGLLAVPILAPQSGVSPFIGSVGGAIVGLLLGFILYRPAVGTTFGVALAGAVALLAVAFLTSPLGKNYANRSTPTDSLARGSESDAISGTPAIALSGPAREAEQIRESCSEFLTSARYAIEFAWEDLSPRGRWIVIGASTAAALAGVFLGIAVPTWAAGGVTALVGAAIWLPCALWLARAAKLPGLDAVVQMPPSGWAITWLAAAALGLGLQWAGLLKSPAPAGKTAAG